MRRTARIAGLAWLALVAMAGVVLMVRAGVIGSNRGLLYMVFAAALPGVMLYRWGRGPYQRPASMRERVAKAFPAKSAAEMGHVERIK
jgi:drug/metabolite transporter (DMT)-like permease